MQFKLLLALASLAIAEEDCEEKETPAGVDEEDW
jgi:hypothetical protein